ncbi:MAG: hypothetical protein JXJ04_15455 [Spirochaetales bacterium]|nr:hypothetical protein [Spirochaetales bacterium]
MNKLSLLFLCLVLLVVPFFLGCPEEGEYEPSDSEVETIIMATLGTGFITTEVILADYIDDGAFDIPGITATVSGDTVTFTFTDCELDLDDIEGVDLTLNGAMSLSMSGDTMTITYDDLNIQGIMPGTDYSIDITISGSLEMIDSVTSMSFVLELTMSGVTDDPVDIVLEMIMPDEDSPTIETATINGYDYADEFMTILTTMFN